MHFQIERSDTVRVYFICKGGVLRFYKSDINRILPLFFSDNKSNNANNLHNNNNTKYTNNNQSVSQNIIDSYNDFEDIQFERWLRKRNLFYTIQ